LALLLVLVEVFCLLACAVWAQDWVKTGTSLGVEKVRLAVPDFKPSTTDPQSAALL
jgi:TolB protein